jgi:hypothetical protein
VPASDGKEKINLDMRGNSQRMIAFPISRSMLEIYLNVISSQQALETLVAARKKNQEEA